MPHLDDTVWDGLEGGYGVPYDPRLALARLGTQLHQEAVAELFENLLHQGDVGIASYAAVPLLVQSGLLELAGAIEVARHAPRNPKLPDWLGDEYMTALESSIELSPRSEDQMIGQFVIIASLKGQHRLARAIMLMNPQDILNEYGTDAEQGDEADT